MNIGAHVRGAFDATGELVGPHHQVDAGHIRYYTYELAGAYSPTDRLMVNASVPVIRSIYIGAFPHPTSVDDGTYHTTYTDLRTELHYQLLLLQQVEQCW